jgi:hypothetical protein
MELNPSRCNKCAWSRVFATLANKTIGSFFVAKDNGMATSFKTIPGRIAPFGYSNPQTGTVTEKMR